MRILHVTCGYLPSQIGGTEIFVHNLNRELSLLGNQVFVNYVAWFYHKGGEKVRIKEYEYEGVKVFVIERNSFYLKLSDLYFSQADEIEPFFEKYLNAVQPGIIHFHNFSPTEVLSQVKVAKKLKIPTLLTYHTPMMTCTHGDMMYLGRFPCDGKIEYRRCLFCTQDRYKVFLPLAAAWSFLPRRIAALLGKVFSNTSLKGPLCTWLQLPWLTAQRIGKWKEALNSIDRFIALSEWGKNLLLANGVLEGKIRIIRQGVAPADKKSGSEPSAVLKLGYLGRIDPVKGVDLLFDALRLLPDDCKVRLDVYGSPRNDAEVKYYKKLLRKSSDDQRISWKGLLAENDKLRVLRELDAVVIPSRWLETGPLVLLEAWSAGTPVIASDLGGISEILKPQLGGILFKQQDVRGLSGAIMSICRDRSLLARIKSAIPPLRTSREMAVENMKVYEELLS